MLYLLIIPPPFSYLFSKILFPSLARSSSASSDFMTYQTKPTFSTSTSSNGKTKITENKKVTLSDWKSQQHFENDTICCVEYYLMGLQYIDKSHISQNIFFQYFTCKS